MNWDQPILTDSGGFKFIPKADSRNITEEGVTLKPSQWAPKMFHHQKRPSYSEYLGSDIMMSFDECPQFYQPYDYVKKSIERTSRWAERGLKAHRRPHDQGLLGIVQGVWLWRSSSPSVIRHDLVSMDFPRLPIGGLAVGETHEEMNGPILTTQLLPKTNLAIFDGCVGAPDSLIDSGVIRGVGYVWLCLPTRIARNGTSVWPAKVVWLSKMPNSLKTLPLDPECDCYTCKNPHALIFVTCSRLMKPSCIRLTSYRHNSTSCLNLMKQVQAIMDDNLFGISWVFCKENMATTSQDAPL